VRENAGGKIMSPKSISDGDLKSTPLCSENLSCKLFAIYSVILEIIANLRKHSAMTENFAKASKYNL
jgi:hypothetical protein